MKWGLIPSWAKHESVGNAHINARSETLPSRNAFREAFKHRRCLISADSFYEWQEREGKRQPFRVMLKSGDWPPRVMPLLVRQFPVVSVCCFASTQGSGGRRA
jgi:putative SOS response-associated peptidase YedK